MKKNIIFGFCLLSILFFSCESTNVSKDLMAIQNELEDTTEEQQIATPSTENDEVVENTYDENHNKENEKLILPEPEYFKEPEITTLEPENKQEQTIAICPSKPEEPEIEPELIIVEDPLPIVTDSLEDTKLEIVELPNKNLKSDEYKTITNNLDENKIKELIIVDKDNKNNKENKLEKIYKNIDDIEKIEITKDDSNKIITDENITEEDDDDVIIVVDSEEEYTENENKENIKIIVPSRSVTIKKSEYVDISYPGAGWIYMGATDNSRNFTYFGRALGTKDTTFSLQGRASGTKILHFYKNDHLTGEYLDDYIEVTVLEEEGSTKTHIAAPSYKQPVPEKSKELFYIQEAVTEKVDVPLVDEKQQEVENKSVKEKETYIQNNINTNTVIENKSEEKNIPTDEKTLLQEAQLLYNEKEFELAINKIEDFLKVATKNIDDGLFLRGQILEAKSEIQNIKKAIESYQILTKEFPASKHWNEANKRIVYLKRFYLEVR